MAYLVREVLEPSIAPFRPSIQFVVPESLAVRRIDWLTEWQADIHGSQWRPVMTRWQPPFRHSFLHDKTCMQTWQRPSHFGDCFSPTLRRSHQHHRSIHTTADRFVFSSQTDRLRSSRYGHYDFLKLLTAEEMCLYHRPPSSIPHGSCPKRGRKLISDSALQRPRSSFNEVFQKKKKIMANGELWKWWKIENRDKWGGNESKNTGVDLF